MTEPSQKGPRVQWSVSEIWALIGLWEDRLCDLRRQKRNGGIYAEMSEAMKLIGHNKSKDQVHNKIENLTSVYRKHLRTASTTGAGGVNWPFYWEIHRFLGSLPANDNTLVDESLCADDVTPAVLELLSETQAEDVPSDDMRDDTSDETSQELPDASTSELPGASTSELPGASTSNSRSGHNAGSSNPAGRGRQAGGASNGTTIMLPQVPESKKRKRPSHPSATLAKAVIEEQKLLRLSLETARGREFTLREQELKIQEKALAVQEKLANAMMAFLNKTG
ncbi:unnamed protein product [Ixodes pacificus]